MLEKARENRHSTPCGMTIWDRKPQSRVRYALLRAISTVPFWGSPKFNNFDATLSKSLTMTGLETVNG
jgi:hypothetical protein